MPADDPKPRGLEAVARKFGPRWSFAAAGLMVVVSLIYYDDITTAEQTGGSFSADPFTGMIYHFGGKWAAIAFWLAFGVMFVLAGLRARTVDRGEPPMIRRINAVRHE